MTVAASRMLRVRVLDVGQGDAIIAFLPGGRRALVVDAFDGERVVCALKENAIDEIVLFLSHSDRDHVDGVQYVLDNFGGRILAFFYNKDRLTAPLGSSYVKRLRILTQATREQAARSENVWSGDFNVNLNSDNRFLGLVPASIAMEVLHPTHDEQGSLLGTPTNEASGVLRIVYTFSDGTTRTILLTGDVQLTGVSCLLHRFRDARDKLRADVLKFPHHGAWPSNHPGIRQFKRVPRRTLTHFLEAVDPEIVVISVGTENNHGHVRPEVFAALKGLRSRKLRIKRFVCTQITHSCLTVAAHDTSACAGDVEIHIGEGVAGGLDVVPARLHHLSRILSLTDRKHAACAPLLGDSETSMSRKG